MRSRLIAIAFSLLPFAAPIAASVATAEERSGPVQSVVFFENRSTGLSPMARMVLDRQVQMIEERLQPLPLALIGQATPDEASEAEILSIRRAEAVRDYLVARGVRPENLMLGNRPRAEAPAVIATPAPATVLIN
ncbi:OmpA family protein [Ferrovibrio sp.]|uniref:OmpA family protein n=1 Tax=Ferrovibrio sp. TaxID=1917215 RepID=UPI0025C4D6ED|nr:OmpA family protein [Ferrovibrio sp.]MBX3454749.1 OmpA family protein [Ferrovibrio sp.]